MRYRIKTSWIVIAALGGLLAAFLLQNAALGMAVFALLLMPAMIAVYIPYAKDNPERLWFKRKLYGWGWTPVTWQGWLATLLYVIFVAAAALSIDETSPTREVLFTFIIPVILLSIAFLRVAYRKGEKPKWQWGSRK